MKKNITSILALIISFVFSSAFADDSPMDVAFMNNYIVVRNVWVLSAPPNAKVMAAYMIIDNESDELRVLTAVSSSRFEKVEMHKTEMHGDMMKMIPQKQLDIPAGGPLILEPGGNHLMLTNPESVPKEGEKVDLKFHFDNSSTTYIYAPVRAAKGGSMMKGQYQ